MFGYNDKITLTATNAINKEGKIIPYSLSFPIGESDFVVPNDIRQISIMEYHEGYETYITESFKIYIGRIISLENLCSASQTNKVQFVNNLLSKANSLGEQVCCYENDGKNMIAYAIVRKSDFVVENTEQLKECLLYISENFKNIKESISNIQKPDKAKILLKNGNK